MDKSKLFIMKILDATNVLVSFVLFAGAGLSACVIALGSIVGIYISISDLNLVNTLLSFGVLIAGPLICVSICMVVMPYVEVVKEKQREKDKNFKGIKVRNHHHYEM